MPIVTVSLLGPFEVALDGRPVSVPRGRQRALLASLALKPSRVVSMETLVDHVWGDEPPRNPRNGLQVHVRRLRAVLGDDTIRTEGVGYRLDVADDDVDAVRFTQLIAAAAKTEPDRAHDLLTEALELWRGEPLAEVDADRLDRDYGAALIERRLLAVERRADHDLTRGRAEDRVAELEELAVRHPLREPLWARLVAALIESGRRPDALDRYEQIRQHLADTLGVDPGADLQRLQRRILDLDGPVALGPRLSLGGGPPLEMPRQLPADPVGFAGREDELAALNELLAGHHRAPAAAQTICVVHGVGGAGKTALAIHWARRVADDFPDGQVYLDLNGYGPDTPVEPAGAVATVLQATGVPTDQLPTDLAALTAMLRTRLAGSRLLILLDNVRDADQVRPLLPGARSMVLVTSRSQLRGLSVRDGARHVAVGELGDRDARKLLAHSIAPARLAAEPQAVRRVVELCSGLPLALRIVSDRAAWQPDATMTRLADDIAHARGRIEGLSGGDDPASDLRAVFSWSYDRLEPDTASTFRRLGLYPGPELTPVGVAALVERSSREARRELDRLVSVHLLEPRGRDRYRLHDLLREYAAELVAGDDPQVTAEAIRRIVDWCLHSVVRARDVLGEQLEMSHGSAQGIDPATFSTSDEVIAWFDTEREMLVAAVRAAADHGLYRQGHELAHLLRTLFHRRLRYEEFVLVAELGVDCARRLGDDLALARGLRTLGLAYSRVARTADAVEPLQEAAERAERIGDTARLASAADNLGIIYARAGDHPAALRYHRRAVDASRRLADSQLLAGTLMNLGYTQIESGDYHGGISTTREALALFEEHGPELSAAFAHGNLADAYQRTARPDVALDHAGRSLATLRRLGDLDATVEVLVTVGRAQQAKGDDDAATAAWKEAAELVGPDHGLSAEIEELLASVSAPTH
jgi:DNA-binding SARP family transcriptional activator/tetratricopeptide (TPR) repeat protein